MFDWIKKLFNNPPITENESDEDSETGDGENFIWCLVGNIINEHYAGTDKVLVHGTKHFSPNTKVYCFPAQWGDGYEKIKVIGRHRKSSKNVCIVIPASMVTNWRLQKVFSPYILHVMRSQSGWTNSETDKDTILAMLHWLPDRTLKIDQ